MICARLVEDQSGVVQSDWPHPADGYAHRRPSVEPMYTTPSTTAGEEKSTSWPSCACHAICSVGTFCAFSTVSKGLTPVWFWLNRNCVQLTSVAGAAVAGEMARLAAANAATTAITRMGFMGAPPWFWLGPDWSSEYGRDRRTDGRHLL